MQLARTLSASTLSPGTGPLTAVTQAWTAYREGAARRQVALATINALAGLDDAALADIGLHRSQIVSVAAGKARTGSSR